MREGTMRMRSASKLGIFVVAILVLVGVAALVGWLGDRTAVRGLNQRADAASSLLKGFKEAGYRKPNYYTVMTEGEAWDSYSQAISLVDSMPETDRAFLSREYRRHQDSDLTQSARVVGEHGQTIELVKRGVRHTSCTAPLDYEQGIMVRFPNYMSLKVAAQLLACRAQLSAEEDPALALDDMVDIAVFGQDIAGGDLTLISHMLGTVCLRVANREMEESIRSFHLEQSDLLRLAAVMERVTRTWPLLSRDVEGEWAMQAVSLAASPELYREMDRPDFFGWWANHLLSWRHFFSYRRVQVDALRFYEDFLSDLKEQEVKGFAELKPTLDEWNSGMSERRNWILTLSMPNLEPLFRRRYEAVSFARVVGTSALVARHLLATGKWPETLDGMNTAGLDSLLVDPMNMEPLKYLSYPGGDSVAIYSVGGDLEDDGGLAEIEKGDLVVTLHRAIE